MTINGFSDLSASIPWLPQSLHYRSELIHRQPEERLRHRATLIYPIDIIGHKSHQGTSSKPSIVYATQAPQANSTPLSCETIDLCLKSPSKKFRLQERPHAIF